MVGPRHVERDHLLEAPGLGRGHGARDGRPLARDDDLARGVEVGRLDARLAAEVEDRLAGFTDDRRHRPRALLAGRLHETPPLGDDPDARCKVEDARGRIGCHLAEA